MMLAGVTVEELVSQVSFKGFMNGKFSPDVAELIKPAMAIYMMGVAEDAGFEAKLFVQDPEQSRNQIEDATFFSIMKERNPRLYTDMVEQINSQERMAVEVPRQAEQEPANESFLTVGEQ